MIEDKNSLTLVEGIQLTGAAGVTLTLNGTLTNAYASGSKVYEVNNVNVFISQLNVNELEFLIEASFPELDKENNRVILEIKQ